MTMMPCFRSHHAAQPGSDAHDEPPERPPLSLPCSSTDEGEQPFALFTPSDLIESATRTIIDPAQSSERSRAAFLWLLLWPALQQPTRQLASQISRGRVLDVACGSGEWARAFARLNPHSQIIGLDRCPARLDDARAHAARQRLTNVAFEQVDVLRHPLPFPDQRFDLVNAHFLASFLSGYADWRPLLRECTRLLRPGGILRLVECVEGLTSSHACQTLYVAYQQALLRAGLCPVLFGPSPQELIFWLDGLLSDAGCQRVERQVRRLTWKPSAGRGAELSGYLLLTLRQVQPFLLSQGVISRGEFERAYRDVSEEIAAGRFAASWQLHISTGMRAQ